MSISIKRNFTIPSTSAIGASELYLTSSTASTTIGTGTLTVAGGAGVSGDSRESQFSQILVYSKALTAQEVLQNYNATKRRYGL